MKAGLAPPARKNQPGPAGSRGRNDPIDQFKLSRVNINVMAIVPIRNAV